MMMVGARGRSLREPPFVVAAHRSGIALPLTGGVQQEWECDGSGAPPPQHQIPHITLAKPISGRGPGLEGDHRPAPGETDGHTSYGSAYLWRLEAEECASAPRRQGMEGTPH